MKRAVDCSRKRSSRRAVIGILIASAACSAETGRPAEDPGNLVDAAASAPTASRRDGGAGTVVASADGATTGAPPNAQDGAVGGADARSPSMPDAAGPNVMPPRSQQLDARPPGGPLPVVFIETAAARSIPPPNTTKIAATMKIIEDHSGTFDWRDPRPLLDRPVAIATPIAINGHGNASYVAPPGEADQKSYNIELRDPQNMERSLPLLGMPEHDDWMLYSCFIDKPCVRNVLTYELGRQMGRWHPRTRFVEVVINGKYNGLYVLMEKIRRDKDRVPIPKLAPDGTGDVTGGYIISVDSPVESPANELKTTTTPLSFNYFYPKVKNIAPNQKAYLQGHMNGFDAMMNSLEWNDPTKGYRAWIDVPSWIDYWMVNEFSNNVDGIWRSAYFYKQPMAAGGKLYAGPLWDFDLAYGNAWFKNGWRWDQWQTVAQSGPERMTPGVTIYKVWNKLLADPPYQNETKCRYLELRETVFRREALHAQIDAWIKEISVAEVRQHQRWPVIGKKVFGSHFVGMTWVEDIDYLKSWIDKRLMWLDANMKGTCKK